MTPIVIRSLNIGGILDIVDDAGRTYRSAVRRTPRNEPQYLGERGFPGDESFGDGHHTPNMDVHVFSLDRYPHYEKLACKPFPVPSFGENFSVSGGIETDVCIGDRFSAGTAVVEVSQPTERCGTPGRSAGVPSLLKWTREHFYTGYYLRVIRPGWVSSGDALVLHDRPIPQWTVDRVSKTVFASIHDQGLYDELLALPLLSSDWKERMRVLRDRRFQAQRF